MGHKQLSILSMILSQPFASFKDSTTNINVISIFFGCRKRIFRNLLTINMNPLIDWLSNFVWYFMRVLHSPPQYITHLLKASFDCLYILSRYNSHNQFSHQVNSFVQWCWFILLDNHFGCTLHNWTQYCTHASKASLDCFNILRRYKGNHQISHHAFCLSVSSVNFSENSPNRFCDFHPFNHIIFIHA